MNQRNQERVPAKYVTYEIGLASTGKEQIGILFEVTDGPRAGQQLTWYGSFSRDAFPITVRALRELGWSGEKIDTLRRELRPGMPVQLVCELEQYQGKDRLKVKFINRRGQVRMDQLLTPEQRRSFAVEVQGMLDAGLGERQPGSPSSAGEPEYAGDVPEDDIPF
jgi:hypothetical protein